MDAKFQCMLFIKPLLDSFCICINGCLFTSFNKANAQRSTVGETHWTSNLYWRK